MSGNLRYPQSVLDKCPPEICRQIFLFACSDDGSSGRSLSLVSKRVHDISRVVKLHSLAIVGFPQFFGCATMLANIRPEDRRVHHLFVSNVPQYDRPDPTMGSPGNTSRSALHEHTANAYRAFKQILSLVAPTLQTFTFVFHIPRPSIILPVSLPHLQHLTLYGPLSTRVDPATKNQQFPALQTLELVHFETYPPDFIEDIGNCAPALKELILKPAWASPTLHNDIMASLHRPPGATNPIIGGSTLAQGNLPPTLDYVYIMAGQKPLFAHGHLARETHRSMLKRVCLMARTDTRVKALQPVKLIDLSSTKADWLKSDSQ
ncbi:hypothetical protein BDN72DRAFT_794093 [Pluteus cervinus]|uniref:Uncharacterized protein n=1 Tax=Pluteus cervinus TaxID=181527 RepID=A0ACD3B029_9AGAR|nr:hypothetical protein BDN72DRAFT_794093 [Pluteus cervinus]